MEHVHDLVLVRVNYEYFPILNQVSYRRMQSVGPILK